MIVFDKPIYDIRQYEDTSIAYYYGEKVLEGKLIRNGLFKKVNLDFFKNIQNKQLRSISQLKVSNELEKCEDIIFTKRHKLLFKKAIFVRIVLGVYFSEINARNFLTFISRINHSLYKNNISAFDFTLMQFGGILASNSEGNKVIGVAQYIDITDIIGDKLANEYLEEIIFEIQENVNDNPKIMEYVYQAGAAALENRHI